MSAHYQSSHWASSHGLSSHYGRIVVEDEGGTAWRPENEWERERPDFYRRQIEEEDRDLLELLTMFLHVMDD